MGRKFDEVILHLSAIVWLYSTRPKSLILLPKRYERYREPFLTLFAGNVFAYVEMKNIETGRRGGVPNVL